MKKLDSILGSVVPAKGGVMPARAGGGGSTSPAGNAAFARDHVDAINQLFAEFELAYHNQYRKAYAQEGSEALAKKYWLNCLREFSPEVIVRAGRQVVRSQEYLPTIAALVSACENAWQLFGLPPTQAAYVEACCASEPKAAQHWSHPAVYLAGKASSWFALATEPQSVIFPVFEYNYLQLCRRVVQGEELHADIQAALPESLSQPLSPEENKARMQALRKKLDI